MKKLEIDENRTENRLILMQSSEPQAISSRVRSVLDGYNLDK